MQVCRSETFLWGLQRDFIVRAMPITFCGKSHSLDLQQYALTVLNCSLRRPDCQTATKFRVNGAELAYEKKHRVNGLLHLFE